MQEHPLDIVFKRSFESIEQALDALEMVMEDLPEMHVDCPLDHVFTPGLYSRTIYMYKGNLIVSRVHNTEHQFFVTKGAAMVFTEEDGWVLIEAGHHGVTKPGARRLLYIIEDCVWSTVHPIDHVVGDENKDAETESDKVSQIERQILLPSRVAHRKEIAK